MLSARPRVLGRNQRRADLTALPPDHGESSPLFRRSDPCFCLLWRDSSTTQSADLVAGWMLAWSGVGERHHIALTPFRPLRRLCGPRGAVAQLGERLNGIQEVVGSIPIGSTIFVTSFLRRLKPIGHGRRSAVRCTALLRSDPSPGSTMFLTIVRHRSSRSGSAGAVLRQCVTVWMAILVAAPRFCLVFEYCGYGGLGIGGSQKCRVSSPGSDSP